MNFPESWRPFTAKMICQFRSRAATKNHALNLFPARHHQTPTLP